MKKIKHFYLIVKQHYIINFKKLETYKIDFLFGIFSSFISCLAQLCVIFFIYNEVHAIKGWTFHEILFIYSLNSVAFSLWSCFCINTISLPYYIKDGDFDRFLLRPLSPLTQIILDGFDDDSFGELFVGILIFIYTWSKLQISVKYLLFVPVLVFSGVMIYSGISILLSTISFFAIARADVANLTMDLREFANYPLTIYPKYVGILFTTLIPLGVVAYWPASILLGQLPILYVLILPIFAILFFMIAKKIWFVIGLKQYSSTGT